MAYIFDINGDYKMQFETYVNKLIITHRESNSEAISNRDVRAEEIKSLTDAYVGTVGERPESKQLERLADLLLYEELHDTHPDKMTREEYPIMSEHQLSRRHSGEVSMKVAEEYGSDRRNYKPPVRRKRTRKETWQIDREAKSRNEERRKAYQEFTRVQAVRVYNGRESIA
ncbi:hypothetical protein CN513_21145 [Bacillus cereus]|uniref:hypothetical protein n=1 Tax=Bacillus cereus TaxID=1396 RepID=UPI000BF51A84|nr:hypothetical protein [Bacillus cereus]QQP81807.1 hypothetical protein JI729_10810 [Bacillus sp. TK-2]PET15020.1 hypothetical protein CN513_21145 [Bacillus cereus]PEV54224.1 hypothetical protein CN422_29140 [Bacillus cereus]PFQ51079.1 hypothetical protein COK24_19410 [Bacillus cereus]PFT53838.1 hypothetical protein COK67_30145 [Bacillus cereus]